MTLHVSSWPQGRILEYFGMMVAAGADRIDLLKQLADVMVQRPADWSPEAIRLEHRLARHRHGDRCFCCRTGDRRLYWHHVVAVANGGDNDHRNQVGICLRCHAAVHPWMNADEPNQAKTYARRHDMESIGDIMLRELDTVFAAVPETK